MKSDWKFGILDDAVDKESSNISLNKIKDDDGEFPVFGAKGFVQNVSFYQQENQYLAIIKDGRKLIGQQLYAISPLNKTAVQVEVISSHYVDKEGARVRS